MGVKGRDDTAGGETTRNKVESGMIISAAAFVQRRLSVGREMTFSSIKSAAFLFPALC